MTDRARKTARTLCRAACPLILFLLLTGCNFPGFQPGGLNPNKPPTSPIRFVAVAKGATPTPTPFQPVAASTSTPDPTSVGAEETERPAEAKSTATPTIAPTVTPSPATTEPPPILSTWPPPNFGGPGPTPSTQVPPAMPTFTQDQATNFLLIGSDRRTTSFRTDTLVIVSIQPQDHLVTLISIPRDLFVYIPGWTMQRINTAYQHGEMSGYPGGGPGLLKDTILYNLGIRIDHLAMIEFDGFREIVDTLGGIDVPLACPFTDWHIIHPDKSDQDPDNWELYTIGPGVVHMDGDLALWYARSRLRSDDFDRGRRQQAVIRAMYSRGLQVNVIPHLPELYNEFIDTVETDVSLQDVLELAPLAASINAYQIRSFYINRSYVTSWRTPENWAVLLPKYDELENLVQKAMSPPDSASQPEGPVIEVRNGTAHKDWDSLAADRLHYAGFETSLGTTDQTDQKHTRLYDFTAGGDPEQADELLQVLGLPSSSYISSPDPGSSTPFRLVLGEDYNPCFNPADLTH